MKLSRPVSRKQIGKTYFLVTEWKETEKWYFKGIKSDSRIRGLWIEIKPIGMGGMKLTKEALSLFKRYLKERGIPFSKAAENRYHCYVILDKDNVSLSDYLSILKFCSDEQIIPIFNNRAFEIWLLMHYWVAPNVTQVAHYAPELTKRIWSVFDKSKDYYGTMSSFIRTALDTAEVIRCQEMKSWGVHWEYNANAYTDVDKLILDIINTSGANI